LSSALAKNAAPLIANPKDNVLPYRHFSVVMHKARRFAIWSAANVDINGRFQLTRPKDVWRFDPRIAPEAQVGEAYYTNNEFDRGRTADGRPSFCFNVKRPAADGACG
jgi:endonuclease G